MKKYYEIVLYSTGAVQRIRYLPLEDTMKFKNWLIGKSTEPYTMTFENSLCDSKTEFTVIFKTSLVNVDFDIYQNS